MYLCEIDLLLMKKTVFYFFLSILFLSIVSCSIECTYPDPGKIQCSDGMNKVTEAQYFFERYHENFENGKRYIINDVESYDSLYYCCPTCYQCGPPFGEIDFDDFTLIGVDYITNNASDIKYVMQSCKSEQAKVVEFKIKYSLKDQCAGQGIETIWASFWAVVPKIPDNYVVKIKVDNVN